jgi:hypothetical protein
MVSLRKVSSAQPEIDKKFEIAPSWLIGISI